MNCSKRVITIPPRQGVNSEDNLRKPLTMLRMGSALAWGARGRRFKSGRPDHFISKALRGDASVLEV